MKPNAVILATGSRTPSDALHRHEDLLFRIKSIQYPAREVFAPIYPATTSNPAMSYDRLWSSAPDRAVNIREITKTHAEALGKFGEFAFDRLEGANIQQYLRCINYCGQFRVISSIERALLLQESMIMELDHLRGHLEFYEIYRGTRAISGFTPSSVLQLALSLARWRDEDGHIGKVANSIFTALSNVPLDVLCDAKYARPYKTSWNWCEPTLRALSRKFAGNPPNLKAKLTNMFH